TSAYDRPTHYRGWVRFNGTGFIGMHHRQFARISPVSYSHKASKFLPARPRSFLRATKYLIDQAMSAPGTLCEWSEPPVVCPELEGEAVAIEHGRRGAHSLLGHHFFALCDE